jgi:predicted transcriptional regulator
LGNRHYGFILISDEKWWRRLCERVEDPHKVYAFVRRGQVGPVHAKKLLFYVKRPVMQIQGTSDFVERIAGNYQKLWERYGHETCLKSYKEYIDFLRGNSKATFIRFTNFHKLEIPVSLELLKRILGFSVMPRGGKYIYKEDVSQIAAEGCIAHGKVRPQRIC